MTWELSYCTLDRSTMFGLPETLAEQFDAAAGAGFRLVSPDIFSLRSYRDANGGSCKGLEPVLAANGLSVYDLSGVTITDDAETSLAELDEFLQLADELSAVWIQSRLPVDNEASRAVYAEAARRVAAAGFGFAFEYSPFVPITTLAGAVDLVLPLAAELPRQAIMIDSWHFYAGGDTLAELARLPVEQFAYLQLDDALEPGDDFRYDTLNRRALPGEGNLPLAEFVAGCTAQGFGGVISVEVMNHELRTLDARTYAARVYEASIPFCA